MYTKHMQQDSQNYWQPSGEQERDEEYIDVPELVEWQASEYIHHEKNKGWYVALVLAGLVFIITAIIILQSITFVALIIVLVAALWVFAMRPPRLMQYRLTPESLHINTHAYTMQDFRSFGIVQEGGVYSIALTPSKRFLPRVTLYFPLEQAEDIVAILEAVLPEEEVKFDLIDRVTRRLRF